MDNNKYWFGSIPDTWTVKKINELFIQRTTKVSDKEYKPLSVTKNGVIPQLTNAAKTDNGNNRKLVCINDFVINSRSDRKSSCGVSELCGSVSLIYIVLYLINNSTFNIKLIHYLFRSHYFSEEFYKNGKGIVADLWTTNYMDMKNIYIPAPPKEEQDKIVAYLDYQVSNINKLILNKRKQIELLEEYKKTKISEVVTKGLNPNVEMKDSGIDWIGQIPKHWEIKKLKDKFNFAKGLSITKEDLNDSGEKVINYGQIHSKNNKSTYITDELIKYTNKVNNSSKTSLGDFIFADTSEDFNGCGNFIYIDKNINLYAGYHTIILKSKYNNHNKFLAYLFLSNIWKQQIILNVSGIKVYSITQKILKNSNILLPPFNEQKKIADYLDNLTLKLDNLVDKHKLYIEKLEEYKKTLISDVVTGKIDVRDITIPKYEKVEIIDNIEDNTNIDELNME